MADIRLRPVRDEDLDTFYDQMRDPEAVQVAAFTAEDPDDRSEFDAHMARVLGRPDVTMRAITVDGVLAGHIASFEVGGDTEITYWLGREWWGRGIATHALGLLLELVTVRPITARAAGDNAGSLAVLRKTGFRPIGTEIAYATGRGKEIEETVLRLDA
ncbi:GNAT family N-acetyltransferase [Actinoplanes friuliensis]|uniref:Putative GCN5-related N-acetyltransferase n=1 Tax=Actinoplanes friuliensis DSM 7358 TaxID=1246995 RepID=U5W707_9ACTN|nr:GNAT family N-acetyltransferase [Actinoplanes friuliensis]AGZ43716.1 putative GCN5-related N-acetyltransferase [Actinoplanes friuliensis DSM 7358]